MFAPPHCLRLRDVIDRYDAIISDVWGVLHNGIVATPQAPEALASARSAGKAVVLLTNAPRPTDSVAEQLSSMGITQQSYDAIISSGGVTRALLQAEGDKPFFHLGPARDLPIFDGLPGRSVAFDEAAYIVCTGLLNDETETAQLYRPLLEDAMRRALPLICANPDLVVERGSTLIPCAGALAELYETLGGKVVWVGKPHPLVYQHAVEAVHAQLGKGVPIERILCIGDAFRTDISGARSNGFDCLMTLAGIHGHEIDLNQQNGQFDPEKLDQLCAQYKTRPTATTVSLSW